MKEITALEATFKNLELQRLNQVQTGITENLKKAQDSGYGDNIMQVVLNCVVRGEYKAAIYELDHYINSRAQFPNFQSRVVNQKKLAQELINAIESKRNFPGLATLPLAKQQELKEHVLYNFKELKKHISSITAQEKNARMQDLRSTVILLKVSALSVFGVFAFAFFLIVTQWLGRTFVFVFDAQIQATVDWIFNFFK
ncbi:MAG: hypothetical protein K1X29_11310 [Bdellovibrionales bacterium]|nr:hypothetical protein [Bdellovibrionales bacterium]